MPVRTCCPGVGGYSRSAKKMNDELKGRNTEVYGTNSLKLADLSAPKWPLPEKKCLVTTAMNGPVIKTGSINSLPFAFDQGAA